jgi:hypothetical protein
MSKLIHWARITMPCLFECNLKVRIRGEKLVIQTLSLDQCLGKNDQVTSREIARARESMRVARARELSRALERKNEGVIGV